MSRRTTETTNHQILNVSGTRIAGNHNIINGGNNEIVGNHNVINGSNNSINGNHNIINGKAKLIKGSFNINNGSSTCTTVIGSHNTTRSVKQPKTQYNNVRRIPSEGSTCSNFSVTTVGGRPSFMLNGISIELPSNTSSFSFGNGNNITIGVSNGNVRHLVDGQFINTGVNKEEEKKEFSFTGFSNDFVDSVANDDERKCCICLENRSCCVLNPCGHSEFCHSCIKKLVNNKVTTCPTCRQTFTGGCKVII